MTRLKPPSPEAVSAATKRIKDTGRVATTDLYVLAASMWFLCEEQGLLDDPRCDLVREATRAVVDTAATAYEAETGRRGGYLELLAWQAAKDDVESTAEQRIARQPYRTGESAMESPAITEHDQATGMDRQRTAAAVLHYAEGTIAPVDFHPDGCGTCARAVELVALVDRTYLDAREEKPAC